MLGSWGLGLSTRLAEHSSPCRQLEGLWDPGLAWEQRETSGEILEKCKFSSSEKWHFDIVYHTALRTFTKKDGPHLTGDILDLQTSLAQDD